MRRRNKIRLCKRIYHGRSPTDCDCKRCKKGDLWYDFIMMEAYILKYKKGHKRWDIYKKFGTL